MNFIQRIVRIFKGQEPSPISMIRGRMRIECPVCKGNKQIEYWDNLLQRDCATLCTVCDKGWVAISSMDFESYQRANLTHLVKIDQ